MTQPIPTTSTSVTLPTTDAAPATARSVSDATGSTTTAFRNALTQAFGRVAVAATAKDGRPERTTELTARGQLARAVSARQARPAEGQVMDGVVGPEVPAEGDALQSPTPWGGSTPPWTALPATPATAVVATPFETTIPRPADSVNWETQTQGDGADRPFEDIVEGPRNEDVVFAPGIGEVDLDGPARAAPHDRSPHPERPMPLPMSAILTLRPSPRVEGSTRERIEGGTTRQAELVPALRTRLERVIDRMAREFGYTVEVVETHRSQERQNQLFAQGRTDPGPVVTWTRVSRHSSGEAADVRIDGGWNDLVAFERLARVAREEGLRSLWPRDPGHLELTHDLLASQRTVRAPQDLTTDLPALAEGDRQGGPREGRPLRGDGPRILPVDGPHIPESGPRNPEDGPRILPVDGPRILPVDGPRNPENGPRILPVGGPRDIHDAMTEHPRSGPARVATVAQVARVATPAAIAMVAQTGASLPGAQAENASEDGASESRPVARTTHGTRRVAPRLAQSLGVERSPTFVPEGTVTASGESHATRSAVGVVDSALARQRPLDRQPEDANLASATGRSAERVEASSAGHETERTGEGEVLHTTLGERAAVTTRDASDVTGIREAGHSDAAERIARVLRLQEGASDRPLSSVVLRLDAPDGHEDRIRVDLRGTLIDTTFDVRDRGAADHMRLHTNELQRALERQGLDGESITIRSLASEPSAASIVAGAEREAARAASASGSSQQQSTGRDGRAPARPDDPRRDADDQRPRDRRSPKGDR